MVSNYLKIAWRNLWRNKVFSSINIIGLALGIACSLLILLWVLDERRVDAFHSNRGYLYAVFEREYAEGEVGATYATPGLLAEELKRVLPEVEYGAGYLYDHNVFQEGAKSIRGTGMYAGNDFFMMFSFPLLQGSADAALKAPGSIALSRKMASAFFGSPAAAVGKTIRYGKQEDLLVTAVFEDVPANSSLQFDYLLSWQALLNKQPWASKWSGQAARTAIMLRKDADPAKVDAGIRKFLDNYYKSQGPGLRKELGMQRFDDLYLHSGFKNGQVSGGRIEYVRLFSMVAIFILLIACINFMNLSTARSAKRAREIGVRKVAGAGRMELVQQFIGETMLYVCFAIGIALLLVYLLLPLFNSITGKYILLPFSQFVFWLQLLALAIITGLIAGSYPAFFLSSFQPVKILKGVIRTGTEAAGFRKGLVIFQFVLSILLIIGIITVSKQINYIRTKNLGYNRENLVYIPLEGNLRQQYSFFRDEALQLTGIKGVTKMLGGPMMAAGYQDSVDWKGRQTDYRPTFAITAVGFDFIRTTGVQLAQGRDFSRSFTTDSAAFLVNETAVRKIGVKDALGSFLTLEDGQRGMIIGVVKDFHTGSLHETIDPMIIRFGKEAWGSLLIRTEAGKTQLALDGLQGLCRRLNPAFPFTYQFADQEYERLYRSEQVIRQLGIYFAALATLISCLGLLGLTLFTAEQRTKEIGIRKVLGASITQLLILLSREFMVLLLVSIIIAIPLGWWLMSQWLQDYAYRTEMSWWIFLLAGALALLTALLTVSTQAIKAALSDPVKSLRAE